MVLSIVSVPPARRTRNLNCTSPGVAPIETIHDPRVRASALVLLSAELFVRVAPLAFCSVRFAPMPPFAPCRKKPVIDPEGIVKAMVGEDEALVA